MEDMIIYFLSIFVFIFLANARKATAKNKPTIWKLIPNMNRAIRDYAMFIITEENVIFVLFIMTDTNS